MISTLLLQFALTLPATATQDSLAAWMGPGISRQLAEYRARTVSNVRYDLTLDVTGLDSAVGVVTVQFRRVGAGDVILDFRGRRLIRAVANGRPVPAAAFNGAHLRVPAALLNEGDNAVTLDFIAEIAPSGASIIRFRDRGDGADYLYTLLVPADANQLFPCFDQPDLKARVTLGLVVPHGWSAVANGPIATRDTIQRGERVRFAVTQPISTYLIAFAAGPFIHHTLVHEGRSMTAWVRRSRYAEADLDTLLTLNGRALDWMERWFARPYPFDKYDIVLAPAFPFGGMEHPGAVFYNEDRFIFRERPTLPQRLGRMSTIFHEVAHMWFGDLVTMRWFDDLWLKEGFATYMAAMAMAELVPEADAWKSFHLANKPAAYGVDQTAGTTPLWQELGNLDQAKSAYGAIVYNKAPAVLRQLNFQVGDAAFRTGVQRFLGRYAFGNATWRELLEVIGEAAGRDLGEFGRHFMLRPGMPEVEQRLTVRAGRIERLELLQRPLQDLSGPGAWPMAARVMLFNLPAQVVELPVLMTGPVTEVATARGRRAPLFVFANAGDYGYFLVRPDSASVNALLAGALGRVEQPLLRAMLWSMLWDEVRAARLAPERFIRLALAELPAERDEQIAPRVLGRLQRAAAAYLDSATAAALRPELERFLFSGASDTARAWGVRRAWLDALVAVASSGEGVARLVALLAADSAAGQPVRDPLRWEIVVRLLVLGRPEAEAALAAQAARDTTPDGRRRLFIAGAARPDAAVKRQYFVRWFADTTLNEDWASGSLGAFNALSHSSLTLEYLRPALDSLRYIQSNRRIFFLGAWLGSFMGGQRSARALEVVREFLAANPGLPADLRRKVLEYSDELERTVRIRERWGG